MNMIMEWLRSRSKLSVAIIAIFSFTLIWGVDRITHPALSLMIFYLVPLFLMTWFVGRLGGISMSILCAFGWFADDVLLSGGLKHPLFPYWNIGISFLFFLLTIFILRRFKETLTREEQYANTDYLTKIANSRLFHEIASLEINRARRYKRPFSLAYLDIDNFKTVNDHFGHSAGDVLLRTIAATIKKNTRNIDLVARLGGDEFTVLFPDTGYEGAESVLRRVQESIADIAREKKWPITASIGVVTCVEPPCSTNELIKWADTLMYKAKNKGKNLIEHEECKK